MKKFRKIMAVLVAVMVVMSSITISSLSAFAAQSFSITIKSRADVAADEGAAGTNTTTYNWYRVFIAEYNTTLADPVSTDADLNTTNGVIAGAPGTLAKPVSYYVESQALADAIAAADSSNMFTVTKAAGANRWYVTLKNANSDPKNIAAALNNETIKNLVPNADKGVVTASGSSDVVIENVGKGYYLIVASNGVNLIAQTLGDVTIYEKNDYPTIDKIVAKENSANVATEAEKKANDVSIGDVLTYQIDMDVPTSVTQTTDGVINEALSEGLTLSTTASDLSVTYGDDGTGTSITTTGFTALAGQDGKYTLTIPAASMYAARGKKIRITYKAILNDSAVINGDGNTNTASLTYGNYTTPEYKTVTKTHKFELKKVDSADINEMLAGAKFTLTRNNGGTTEYYRAANGTNSVWTTDATEHTTTTSDNLKFEGLDSGTYTLTETTPPTGYLMISAPITVVVGANGSVTYTCADTTASGTTGAINGVTDGTAEASDYVLTLANKAGVQLPSTGGMGTTVLYIVGGMLVILAGAYLFFSRKKTA